jgi:anti-anti-sigma factor
MGGMRLEVEVVERQGAVIVHLVGHAGVHQVGILEDGLLDVLADLPELVILDVHRLDFIGDQAMAVLAAFRQQIIRQDGHIVLAGASDSLKTLLKAGSISGLFPKVLDVETALSRIKKTACG